MSGDEYPKVIHVGGIDVTVCDAADEARWLAPPPPPEIVPTEPAPDDPPPDALEEIVVEMDNPIFNEPKKPTRKKK